MYSIHRRHGVRIFLAISSLFALCVVLGAAVLAQTKRGERLQHRSLPASVSRLRLDAPMRMENFSAAELDLDLFERQGRQQVSVQLRAPSVGRFGTATAASARAHRRRLDEDQTAFLDRGRRAAPDMQVLARTQLVLNAVFLEVDVSSLAELARDPSVARIAPVRDYEMFLPETVPHVGATAVQAAGFDGTGVKVAILDSGVDYTHVAFGGPGTPGAYEDAYGVDPSDPSNTTRDGLFPTARVVEGFDFVGERWVGGAGSPPLMPDPDPIGAVGSGGHGTHVADIAGGSLGVAPGVDLYAVKVCSATSTACSGVALIQAMEFSVDPNEDGDTSDHVDIVNMSLGALYGQPFDDDLSAAVDAATELGVLTVAAAGNSADKPYVLSTPSAADTALSVAQTYVPSDAVQGFTVEGAGEFPAVFQTWSTPLTSLIAAPVQYGNGSGGNRNGCAPFASGAVAGKIVFVDRGACNFTLKIKNIGVGGGLLGIIGLVAPGEPFPGGDGGDRPIGIPGFMVSQTVGSLFRNLSMVRNAAFDPDAVVPSVGKVVGSSSRGPQFEDNRIKPEIGAPGASVSAVAGGGTSPFGGTSGATPMVAGAAALLMEAFPDRSPLEIKALLMNTAEIDIGNSAFDDSSAPISRIGGGELRVDRALAAADVAAAWDKDEPTGSLGFGFHDVSSKRVTLRKRLRLHNYSNRRLIMTVEPSFRFDNDADNGAVEIQVPPLVFARPGEDVDFAVTLRIAGEKLRQNLMNSGSGGADAVPLTQNEYDGYLTLTDGETTLRVPWHVLPRKAAALRTSRLRFNRDGVGQVRLQNRGVGDAQNDAYALLALSDDIPEGDRGEQSPTPDLRAVGVNTFTVPAGFCSGSESFVWTFAVSAWERSSHADTVSYNVWLDLDRDGEDDYLVLNRDFTLNDLTDGRNLTWAVDLSTGNASAFFFTEHATNTGNTVLIVCAEQVGLGIGDAVTHQVDVDVEAEDIYFGGPGDLIEDLTISPFGERYFGVPDDVAGSGMGAMPVLDFGQISGNTRELGFLLFTNGDRGSASRGGATEATEALLVLR